MEGEPPPGIMRWWGVFQSVAVVVHFFRCHFNLSNRLRNETKRRPRGVHTPYTHTSPLTDFKFTAAGEDCHLVEGPHYLH